MTKLVALNGSKTQKQKLWWNSKTQMIKMANSICDYTRKLNCRKTQRLILWQNSKTKVYIITEDWNSDKAEKTLFLKKSIYDKNLWFKHLDTLTAD